MLLYMTVEKNDLKLFGSLKLDVQCFEELANFPRSSLFSSEPTDLYTEGRVGNGIL